MSTAHDLLKQHRAMPLVAILRGLDTASAVAVGEALVQSGFRILEVPLNRPGALECIASLTRALPAGTLIGGGTMLTVDDVNAVHAAGGRLMVSPNCDVRVIRRAVELGMVCAPGVATPSEAFTALEAGAHALKLFPAEMVGHGGLKAFKSVLPTGIDLWPVGGITPESMAAWVTAGATGFGIGSQLYAPGKSAADVLVKARQYVQAWQATSGKV
ncbi:2-dehydro-3-deoxy-6-phosphogalactonate aldolase [Rhodoferax saidenbachensis]|uniref:2-dehydro-3-deoxy-6-phosphogalactonate aldolase n=1 Tax=Rhodoferax saidenbachensis TaxID=1484693 RepID=A0A1P8KEC6_9BURK|nr:2-dehydro-3-deoxy-6-phosphogalactonate aldolase [Rhodoferax saidenbachensis]APW44298.1 2-dehydro-3-deoxy-6-phosphogalactonate aldolase [Rhodoferax saidenbachensis]